jgi:hypothetical protein
MSYVQGTVVQVEANFSDEETGQEVLPEEVTATVQLPDGTISVRTLTGGGVYPDPLVPGRYFSDVDTTPAYGTWWYQFESTGPTKVVAKKQLTVRRRIGV